MHRISRNMRFALDETEYGAKDAHSVILYADKGTMWVDENKSIKNSPLLPLKLYWSSRSPFVRKVMIAVYELGLGDKVTTEPVYVDGFTQSPVLEPFNPTGQIPTLVTADDTVVYDSDAIIDYLDAHFGGRRLFPTDYPSRLDVLRRAAIAQSMIEKALRLVVTEFRKRMTGIEEPGQPEGYKRSLNLALDSLESTIDAWSELPVDAGHIGIAALLGYLDFRLDEPLKWRRRRPELAAWHAEFAKRPSYTETEFSDPGGVFTTNNNDDETENQE